MDNCPPMLCTGLDCAVVTERNGCQVCQVFFILSFTVLQIVLECFKFPIINGIVFIHFVSGFIHATPVFPSVRPVSCVAAWRQRQFHSQCHCHTLFPSPFCHWQGNLPLPYLRPVFPSYLPKGLFFQTKSAFNVKPSAGKIYYTHNFSVKMSI